LQQEGSHIDLEKLNKFKQTLNKVKKSATVFPINKVFNKKTVVITSIVDEVESETKTKTTVNKNK
jgi:hypothetical protein